MKICWKHGDSMLQLKYLELSTHLRVCEGMKQRVRNRNKKYRNGLGTANTIVYAENKGIVLREPSVVAKNTKTEQSYLFVQSA